MGLLEDFFRFLGREIAEGAGNLKDHLLHDELGVSYHADPADDVKYMNEHVRRRLRLRALPRPALDIDESATFPCVRGTKDPGLSTLTEQFLEAARQLGWKEKDVSDFFGDRSEGWSPPQELIHPFKVAKRDLTAVRRFTIHPGELTTEEDDQELRESHWKGLIDREDFEKERLDRDEQEFESWREQRRALNKDKA